MGSVLISSLSNAFQYVTPKNVRIENKKVGVVNRLVQLTILLYIIGWVIIYNHGYQEFSTLESSVTSKVRGAIYTNDTHLLDHQVVLNPNMYNRIWDAADYVIPPQQNGAFFVMTNAVISPNQTRGICPTFPGRRTICDPTFSTNELCAVGKTVGKGQGVTTGNCVKYNEYNHTCEVHAWCPVDNEALPSPYDKRPLLQGTEHFTVLIKNSIRFTLWPEYITKNIRPMSNVSRFKYYTHDERSRPFCPIFKLGQIVESTGANYTSMATLGGVVGIMIKWDCNLDGEVRDCVPKYSFRRLDDPHSNLYPGWSFKFARFHDDNTRTLYKAFGILFIVMVEGHGRQFNIKPLLLNIASGLALLSIATIICDVIVLYCVKKRNHYREQIYSEYLLPYDNKKIFADV